MTALSRLGSRRSRSCLGRGARHRARSMMAYTPLLLPTFFIIGSRLQLPLAHREWLQNGILNLVDEPGDLRRVPYAPYVDELRRWYRLLNKDLMLDAYLLKRPSRAAGRGGRRAPAAVGGRRGLALSDAQLDLRLLTLHGKCVQTVTSRRTTGCCASHGHWRGAVPTRMAAQGGTSTPPSAVCNANSRPPLAPTGRGT